MLIKKVVYGFQEVEQCKSLDELTHSYVQQFVDMSAALRNNTTEDTVGIPPEYMIVKPSMFEKYGETITLNTDTILLEKSVFQEQFRTLAEQFIRQIGSISSEPWMNQFDCDVSLYTEFFRNFKDDREKVWKPGIDIKLIQLVGKTYSFFTIEVR